MLLGIQAAHPSPPPTMLASLYAFLCLAAFRVNFTRHKLGCVTTGLKPFMPASGSSNEAHTASCGTAAPSGWALSPPATFPDLPPHCPCLHCPHKLCSSPAHSCSVLAPWDALPPFVFWLPLTWSSRATSSRKPPLMPPSSKHLLHQVQPLIVLQDCCPLVGMSPALGGGSLSKVRGCAGFLWGPSLQPTAQGYAAHSLYEREVRR